MVELSRLVPAGASGAFNGARRAPDAGDPAEPLGDQAFFLIAWGFELTVEVATNVPRGFRVPDSGARKITRMILHVCV